jgi:IstB-like ATP binding protein
VVEPVLCADAVIVDEVGFAPLDDTGAQLLFRFLAAADERRALAIASHWPCEDWGRFLPNETTRVVTRPAAAPRHRGRDERGLVPYEGGPQKRAWDRREARRWPLSSRRVTMA